MYIKHHFKYIVSLTVVMVLFLFLIYQLNYSKQLQTALVVGASIFYVLWGVIHHVIHHNLTSKIVVEYTLIGSLGMAVMLFFLKGGIF